MQICGRTGCVSELIDKEGFVYPAIFIDDNLWPVNPDSLELARAEEGQNVCTFNNAQLSKFLSLCMH